MLHSNGVPTVWGFVLLGCLVAAIILKLVLTNLRRQPSGGFVAGSDNSTAFSWGGGHGDGNDCGGGSGNSDGGSCGDTH
jgi:hypothetical protein